jgi:hypothetical protein
MTDMAEAISEPCQIWQLASYINLISASYGVSRQECQFQFRKREK